MKLGNTVFCLLLLGGLSTSCIREDLSDCFSTNTLLLSNRSRSMRSELDSSLFFTFSLSPSTVPGW